MAATSTYMASTYFSMLGWTTKGNNKQFKRRNFFSVSAQQTEVEELKVEEKEEEEEKKEEAMKKPRPVEPQINVESKNMSREYGGQWLSCATRHGAPLTEYTLRLIGSDIEHYIRKLLYTGEIQYNMNARVLNFSMGKPRVGFNYNGQMEDVNQ